MWKHVLNIWHPARCSAELGGDSTFWYRLPKKFNGSFRSNAVNCKTLLPEKKTKPNSLWTLKGPGAAAVPFSQKVPVQPAVQVQAPLTWSQAAPFWHWQLDSQPGPKLPSGHPAAQESQPDDGLMPEQVRDQWGIFYIHGKSDCFQNNQGIKT